MTVSSALAPAGPGGGEGNVDARRARRIEEEAHGLGGRHVRLGGIVEPGGEPGLESGLQRVQLLRVELVEAVRHAREARQLGAVARAGDHQRALGRHARIGLAPQGERLEPQLAHDRLRRFRLAVGGEHGAGKRAGGLRERLGRALDEPHAMAPPRQRQRLPQADDAGAGNGDGACLLFMETAVRGGSSISPRHALAPGVGAALQHAVLADDDERACRR